MLKAVSTNGDGGGGGGFGPNAILIDPRNYGAKATGWYGVNPSGLTIVNAGTGFAVGDTFQIADQTQSGRTRGNVPAQGIVTSVSSGGITGFTITSYGSGYQVAAGGIWLQPLTGLGVGAKLAVGSIWSGPSNISVTIVSGGNATQSGLSGSYFAGSQYAVGDIVAIPNGLGDNNYATARINSISNGKVASLQINNPGGGYTSSSTPVSCITITGYGEGLTVTVNSTTQPTSVSNTFDDTYGYMLASVAACNAGGAVLVIDNSYVANLMPPSGTTLIGQNWAPPDSYDNESAILAYPKPHLFCIGQPNFVIDCNAQVISCVAFTICGVTNSAYGTTGGMGSYNGVGGFVTGYCYAINMSFKFLFCGIGNEAGTGGLMFVRSQLCDYGACQWGVYGPMSDWLDIAGEYVAGTGAAYLTTQSQFCVLLRPRCEYNNYGFHILGNNGGGGGQIMIVDAQFDRISYWALFFDNALIGNVTGAQFRACGLAGTLTVTGAANNGSGLVRLTVTGWGIAPNGGSTATSGLVTGDKANISGIVGTTEANGNQWTITVIDGTHIDLQGSTYSNAYVSGGNINVNTKGSPIVISNSTDLHFSNCDFIRNSAGQDLASAGIIDSTGSSRISFMGGTANQGNGVTGSYQQAFANWHNSGNTPPALFSSQMTALPWSNANGSLTNLGTPITASTYTINSSTQSGITLEFNNSSGIAIGTIAATSLGIGFNIPIKNTGTGDLVFTFSSGAGETGDGQATAIIAPNTCVIYTIDSTYNWYSTNYGNALNVITKQFTLPVGDNGTIVLDSFAAFTYTVIGINGLYCSSGSIVATMQIASITGGSGTNITGLASLTASATPANYSATGANTVALTRCLQLVLSSNSSATNISFSLQLMRTS